MELIPKANNAQEMLRLASEDLQWSFSFDGKSMTVYIIDPQINLDQNSDLMDWLTSHGRVFAVNPPLGVLFGNELNNLAGSFGRQVLDVLTPARFMDSVYSVADHLASGKTLRVESAVQNFAQASHGADRNSEAKRLSVSCCREIWRVYGCTLGSRYTEYSPLLFSNRRELLLVTLQEVADYEVMNKDSHITGSRMAEIRGIINSMDERLFTVV